MTNNILPMPQLFDRSIKPNHSWFTLHTQSLSNTPVENQAYHANLSMDNRVSIDAEVNLIADAELKANLKDSMAGYFVNNYCREKSSVKFIASSIALPLKRELFRLGSLTSMVARVVKNDDNRSNLLLALTEIYGSGSPVPVRGKVDMPELISFMNGGGEDNFRQLIEVIHQLLGDSQPFWWATFAIEVKAYNQAPDLLCDALGLGEHLHGDALLIYQYKAADAGLIYKPTVIESNTYAFHYPIDNSENTGLTMSLSANAKPCSEVLHHSLEAAVAAQAVLPKVLILNDANRILANQYQNLAEQRQAHRAHLTNQYSKISTWLGRHSHRL